MEDVAAIAAEAFAAPPESDSVHLSLPTAGHFAVPSNQTLMIPHSKSCKVAHDVNAELQKTRCYAAALNAENAQVRKYRFKIKCQSCLCLILILCTKYSNLSVGKHLIHYIFDWMGSGDIPSAAHMA